MPQTLEIVSSYMQSIPFKEDFSRPLFFNKQGKKLTRAGISYILNKYITVARFKCPELFPKTVTPHTLRHSKAMHLLEGGVNLVYIRDFLGHTSVITTEIYAKSNPEIKRKAVENVSPRVLPKDRYTADQKQDMVNWLKTII
jgi:site-specific recombinase XerD